MKYRCLPPLPPWHWQARLLWTLARICFFIALSAALIAGGRLVAETVEIGAPAPPGASIPAGAAPPRDRDTLRNGDPRSVTTSRQLPVNPGSEPDHGGGPPAQRILRVIIPAIRLDAPVVPVGWRATPHNGQVTMEWEVAAYAVGHHRGSGLPGRRANIVLAGHVGGLGAVFRDLHALSPGDRIMLQTDAGVFSYQVVATTIVPADSNTDALNSTAEERLTLITCWPPNGPGRFSQRLILVAAPASAYGTKEPAR